MKKFQIGSGKQVLSIDQEKSICVDEELKRFLYNKAIVNVMDCQSCTFIHNLLATKVVMNGM